MTFTNTEFGEPICRLAMPLLVEKSGEWMVMGTCVMLLPGLAITAKHVIESCFAHFDRLDLNGVNGDVCAAFTVRAVELRESEGRMWWGKKVFFSRCSDLALVSLAPLFRLNPAEYFSLKMTAAPPVVGTRVGAFGYSRGHVAALDEITATVDPRTTCGDVVEVLPRGRDQRLRFPCFRFNARVDGGMSGGPVFDEHGWLCGVLCSSLPATTSEEEHVSYAATLWPLLGIEIDLPRRSEEERYPLVELARDGVIDVAGWQRFVLSENGSVGFYELAEGSYR